MNKYEYDIVVVGHGMAGLSAGLRAAELGRDVVVLEKTAKDECGGQTGYSESFRVPSAETDLTEWGYEFDVPDYTVEEFYDDIMKRTNGRANSDLARTLVENAGPIIEWLTEHGVDWETEPLAVGYTAGRTWFDNDELVAHLADEIESSGGDRQYETSARRLLKEDGHVIGLETAQGEGYARFNCKAVILACGGYESSPEKRARYYGSGYDDMKVRGSGYNTGEAIEMALDAGANAAGQWSGAHMALIDANSSDVGGGANRVDGYQYGIIIDVEGERFLNEGESARAHTYAKFGRKIFERSRHLAYVVLDSKTHHLVRATGPSDPYTAETANSLVEHLDVDGERALTTIRTFNNACDPGEFDPHILDGNNTEDVRPPKSNWALPIDDPPFYAYPVTGGITFSFGGVEANSDAEVLDDRGHVVSGLYAAGNATGKLFYHNYPGGTGLMNAAVYGKIAAERADEYIGT